MKGRENLFLLGIALLFALLGFMKPAYATEEVTLYLHKRVFPDITAKIPYDLTIPEEKKTFISQTLPQNGANFVVYDLHQPVNEDEKVKEIDLSDWQDATRRDVFEAATKYKVVAKGQTTYNKKLKMDGVAEIQLPQESQQTKPLYLILEVKAKAGSEINGVEEQSAAPKVFDPKTNKSTTVELFLETVNYSRHPYFFNYGKMRDGKSEMPLAGVEYILYKLNAENERLYLEKNELADTWYSWSFATEAKTDTRLERFSSNEAGLITTNHRNLPPGTYYFEEVKTVPGFDYDGNIQDIEVVIPPSWTDKKGNFLPATVNGEGICEMRDGKVPEIVLQRASPKIFHLQRARNRVKKISLSNLATVTKQLPQKAREGELNFEIGLIFLFLIIVSLFVIKQIKKRKRKLQ